jgi:hypothetical protein
MSSADLQYLREMTALGLHLRTLPASFRSSTAAWIHHSLGSLPLSAIGKWV